VVLDIDNRKHIEEATVSLNQALRDSEERYRMLFESIDQGFCVIQVLFDGDRAVDYRYLVANPAFERQTGIRNAVGRCMRELDPRHEDHWFDTYGRVALTGEPVRFENAAVQQGREYDGYAWRVGDPAERRVAVLFNDITQRKLSEEALREADRRKDEFLAILSHELRNPLAPIGYAVQVLKKKGDASPDLQWARDLIERQVRQMGIMLDDLMDVARITRGTIELRKQTLALAPVVDDVVEACRPLIERGGQTLSVALPSEPVMLDADPTRIGQILLNLLNNATKYTERGGHIEVTAQVVDEMVELRVKDTGIGITADMLPRVFDLFTQAERSMSRSQGGLGIGLTLVQRLAQLHGGAVEARSEGPGKGSEFIMRLPCLDAQKSGLAESVSDGKAAEPASLRVLVVDDNEDGASSMAMWLESLGHTTRTAGDGIAGVQEAIAFEPDVVLLDLGMPRMNGFEAARRIRESLGSEPLIIAVTGWGQEAERRRSREAGFDHHLTKPVDVELLKRLMSPRFSGRAT
jgi:signal transduction histidine kinase/CheY-like chemotaxis protein